jgi:hypothetical protein
MMKRFLALFLASVVLSLCVGPAMAVSASDAPRMTKEQLKPLLGSPDVIILDVRSAPDYNGSQEKIKGAVREEPGNMKALLSKYPNDKTLVLY